MTTLLDGEEPVADERCGFEETEGAPPAASTNPKLWWPNGMGDQPLYDAAASS